MTIYRLLQKCAFDPDEISRLVIVYEDVLRALGLSNLAVPMTEVVALKVIDVARSGEPDPARIKQIVLEQLGIHRNS